jgi:hypothetical protein
VTNEVKTRMNAKTGTAAPAASAGASNKPQSAKDYGSEYIHRKTATTPASGRCRCCNQGTRDTTCTGK